MKKIKLRDMTGKQFIIWVVRMCYPSKVACKDCVFNKVDCKFGAESWVYHKDMYSDKFLDQEVEVEEDD